MLGLPKATELNRQLPKNAIYAKFGMNSASRNKIDADISRIVITNELSSSTTNIVEGEEVKSIFVVLVKLKRRKFSDGSIITLSKLIPQNMLFVLEYGTEAKLAIYHTKLIETKWQDKQDLKIGLNGLNLDFIWDNIVTQIGNIHIERGKTLIEQIELDERQCQIEKEIEKLDKRAWREKQPKKKFELVQEINRLREELGK